MSILSVFMDESGDFGPYSPHSPCYIITLLMHDQSISINEQVERLRKHVAEMGFDDSHDLPVEWE